MMDSNLVLYVQLSLHVQYVQAEHLALECFHSSVVYNMIMYMCVLSIVLRDSCAIWKILHGRDTVCSRSFGKP